jgi:hypothetical protein
LLEVIGRDSPVGHGSLQVGTTLVGLAQVLLILSCVPRNKVSL